MAFLTFTPFFGLLGFITYIWGVCPTLYSGSHWSCSKIPIIYLYFIFALAHCFTLYRHAKAPCRFSWVLDRRPRFPSCLPIYGIEQLFPIHIMTMWGRVVRRRPNVCFTWDCVKEFYTKTTHVKSSCKTHPALLVVEGWGMFDMNLHQSNCPHIDFHLR